jgi:hypothetical protein
MAPWAVRDVPKGIPDPDNADLLSANLLVKQNLRLGIFKTKAAAVSGLKPETIIVGFAIRNTLGCPGCSAGHRGP